MECNHSESVLCGLREAEALCLQNSVRLTKLRREILALLLAAQSPVKAYDLIEQMRVQGERLTPASIYRTLDFLLQYGLAHRINSLNAYVPCTGGHDERALLMFVCSACQQAKELEDRALYDSMQSRLNELGISLNHSCIEIQGTCRECTQFAKHQHQ